MIKNWTNYVRMSCKAPNNLVNLIDYELDLEQELNEFEGSFDQDELKEDFPNYFFFHIFET
jgi:hypothetical protein